MVPRSACVGIVLWAASLSSVLWGSQAWGTRGCSLANQARPARGGVILHGMLGHTGHRGVDRPHERIGRRLLDEVPQDCLEPVMDGAIILRPEAWATHKTPAALNERLEPCALIRPACGVNA